MINCDRTTRNACYDLEGFSAEGKKVRLEVKKSSLGSPNKDERGRPWIWSSIRGRGGNKEYDRLILLGEADERYRKDYKDSTSPYIIFDIPFQEVDNLIVSGGTSRDMIRLGSNPGARRRKKIARARVLFDKYQLSFDEFKERYNFDKSVREA